MIRSRDRKVQSTEIAMRTALAVSGLVVAMFVAACSSSPPDIPNDVALTAPPRRAPKEQAGTSSPATNPPAPAPAPGSGDGTDSAGAGALACPQKQAVAAADFDASVSWRSAARMAGACNATDGDSLEKAFADPNLKTWVELGTRVSPACRACVISYDSDAAWGLIVATAADGGATGFVNFGACFGHLEGAPCGKAMQYEQFCYGLACDACPAGAAEQQTCTTKASEAGGMCETFARTRSESCPNIQANLPKCGTIRDAVTTLCGA
jgi:hypothetical protein